jgi:photosystem II stability/assembly factor-like uncharacterized protein
LSLSWVPRTSGTSAYLLAACYGAADSLNLIVGDSLALSSPTGEAWTLRDPEVAAWLSGITYSTSAGSFIGVGQDGTVVTTLNGIDYDTRVSGTTLWLNAAAYSPTANAVVAVGESGKIIRSTNGGVTWASVTSGTTEFLLGVTYDADNNQFVAVGTGGKILTSPTGVTWTSRTSGIVTDLNAVSAGPDAIVAVGPGGVVLISVNAGVTWTPQTSGTGNDLYAISNDGAQFVAVGSGGTIIIGNAAGTAWESSSSGVSNGLFGIGYDSVNEVFVAVGDGGRILTAAVGVVIEFGDVEQDLTIVLSPPFGDVEQALDITLVPPWTYWADRVMQPLTIRLTSFGDVEQPLNIAIAAAHGDVSQPLDIRLTGHGDVLQPLTVALIDPDLKTTGWRYRVLLDDVDVSARLTGQASVRGEEGGARIARFRLKPAVGPIDAVGWVGAPVVIDILTRAGSSWVARRLFTGKAQEPDYDLDDGTVSFLCTDDLQNRIAEISRETLDTITQGRYAVEVQGEQPDNWEYAQALMQTIPGKLDADPYGALRVTPWHGTEVWATYTRANTKDGSIFFTLPQRGNIINKIVATFEYRYSRLHRRTAYVQFKGNLDLTIQYGLPLLARDTVEAALENTGWSFFYGGGIGGGPPNANPTRVGVTDGEPVKRDIDYIPYPETVDVPGGGVWYQNESESTCLEFACRMWRRWAQTVTDTYTLTVIAPESIDKNGVISREERASLASEWDAGAWESDEKVEPILNGVGKAEILDHAPDATPERRDEVIATLLDVCNVRIDGSHRSGRGGATTWLTPELDLDKRVRIEDEDGSVGEGKVIMVEHVGDMDTGLATTQFEIAIFSHGAVGLPTPDETPRTPPEAPGAEELSAAAEGALHRVTELHIGALAESLPFDPTWTGWIVNVPSGFNIDDPGSTSPKMNPETQKTERELVNDPYKGTTANPFYRADKAYATTGFRVTLPAIETEARDAIAPEIKADYTLPIIEDDFILYA